MLAPRFVIFSSASLLGSSPHSTQAASEALGELERRKTPLVLATAGTRAQIEALRGKIEHAHPFITESGGGLFLPDGYFALRIERARRVARYLCVPFGQSAQEARAAIESIAAESQAEAVSYTEMNAREIARNTGMNLHDAAASRDREFSERFFLAGNAEAAAPAFEEIALRAGWRIRQREQPFWELYSGNDEGKAVVCLMQLYRKALRSQIRSVGIGSSIDDLRLLQATDQRLIVPLSDRRYDDQLLSQLPSAVRIDIPATPGWNQAVLDVLKSI